MILYNIVERKNERIRDRKITISGEIMYHNALELSRKFKGNKFKEAVSKDGLSIIGEFKKASPSKGVIVKDFKIEDILKYYKKLNVDAFSVLTEEDFFLGSDEYLLKVKQHCSKPILRKDFIIDFYQIYESKVLGADAILLIVALLKSRLKEFYDVAKSLNLDVLVEVHNKDEIRIALECGCEIIGINNRDLRSFKTSLDITRELIKYIPKDKIIISESGIKTIEDLEKLKVLGINGVLVGEMFMRNISNKEFLMQYRKRISCED
ncbi:MAG: indole-3-glycerol phosphate synthase TrpC [Clostridium sp.]